MARRRRRRQQEVKPPVASMGDIAFLLIIFFVLCGNFIPEGQVEVTLPAAEEVKEVELDVAAKVAVDKEGRIFLDGIEVSDAKMLEAGVAATLNDKETEQERLVEIRIDRAVTANVFEPVIQSVAEGGGRPVLAGEEE